MPTEHKRFNNLVSTPTGWKTDDDSIVATKTDTGIVITDNRDEDEKFIHPVQEKVDNINLLLDRLQQINKTITERPKTITLPYIPSHLPGAQTQYPFKRLQVGTAFRVPYPRCTKHSLYCSLLRFQKNNPEKMFSLHEPDKIEGEPYRYYVVTRVK